VRAHREPPALWQFLLLSGLVHVLFIALFGAPSGGSREGRAMWGSMQVELQGLLVDPSKAPAVSRPDAHLAPTPFPAPTRQDRVPAEGAVPMTPPADTQAAATAPLGPAIVEVPAPFPRLLDRLPASEIPLAEPPKLRVPPPTEGRDLRPPPRERPEPSPVEVPAPLPLTPAPSSERTLAEPPTLTIPLAQPLPAPPAPVAPALERTPPAPAPAQTIRPAEEPPVEVIAVPVPPLEAIAPRSDTPVPALELTPLPRIEPAPAGLAPASPEPQLAPAVPGPSVAPAPPGGRPSPGARRPGDAASDYDPTAPSLDGEALRARARGLAREGTGQRALLPFAMPPVPEKKSQMEQAIEAARKPDCRTAYQSLGLLAVVPLVANEFGEGNCRWSR